MNPNIASEIGMRDPEVPWVDVIKVNRLPQKSLEVKFFPPIVYEGGEVEVSIDEDDVQSELIFWKHTLVLYYIGKDLSMNAVKQFIMKVWDDVQMPKIFYNEDGYFLLKFKWAEECENVMLRGPYTIFNAPVILKKWTADFKFAKEDLKLVPIWVQFPQLPLVLWGTTSLGKIASALGKPMYMDECTSKKLRVSFARVMIEVDISKQLRKTLAIKNTNGDKYEQLVIYEWMPPIQEKMPAEKHQQPKGRSIQTWAPQTKPAAVSKGKEKIVNETGQGEAQAQVEKPPQLSEKSVVLSPKECTEVKKRKNAKERESKHF